MRRLNRKGWAVALSATAWVGLWASGSTRAAEYGRVVGTVTDGQGVPLQGASVLIVGPVLAVRSVDGTVLRVVTDAHGKFTAEHLIPGWYSLRVTSASRLPATRSGVRVEAGGTSQVKLVLSDLLAPLRVTLPTSSVSRLGDDWKWVLRTSASTRPVLRLREATHKSAREKGEPLPAPADQRMVGMVPGSPRRGGAVADPGLGSVLAYLRPLSEDADLLLAGSMAADGFQAASLTAAFRNNLLRGAPQELSLSVHQLSLSTPGGLATGERRRDLYQGQGVSVRYGRTQQISPSLSLTTGFDVDYLNAVRDAMAAHPRLKLEYELTPSTSVTLRYGMARGETSGTLLERVGMLNTFPRVTLRKHRPRVEQASHLEASLARKVGKKGRLELAAFRDNFRDAAVWGSGKGAAWNWLAGDILLNPASNGVVVNAGEYRSSGVRAAYTWSLGDRVEGAFIYTVADGLSVDKEAFGVKGAATELRGFLHPARSQFAGGRLSGWIPVTRTYIVTSYGWLPAGRVTAIDPAGLANLQLDPFLGVQVRQPLPAFAFIPAQIEALADFRNLLGQGSVSVAAADATPVLLTAAYRSFRGGFSVQF